MLNRRELIVAGSAMLLASSARRLLLAAHLKDGSPAARPAGPSDAPALGRILQAMRASASPVRKGGGSFADVFTDVTGIDRRASRYYDHDVRKVVGTQRAFAETVAPQEDFESIADWTRNVGVRVVDPRDKDPMVGRVAELDSGGKPGNVSVLRKRYGAIPATFGVSVLMGMTSNLRSAAEALEMQVQNGLGHLLQMRVYSRAVEFFYNGTWHRQFAYGGGPSILTEWWCQARHNGSSNYTIRLFAGTQELPGFTGNLPGGTKGENGWVGFIQYSAAVPHRKSQLAFLQIGGSALPANMDLVSVPQNVGPEPSLISLAILFEDVSAQTIVNTDLKAWISKDGGSSWSQVRLASVRRVGNGILDAAKPVYLAAGQITLPRSGTSDVCCRITSANGRYFSLLGYAWQVDA